MTAPKSKTPKVKQEIPEEFIYEMWDGKPVYYAGYKEALKNRKESELIEHPMPSSFLQSLIVMAISYFLKKQLEEYYFILSNEIGVNIKKGNHVANDIAVIAKNKVKNPSSQNYANVPPKIVFEVDIKAATENFANKNDYFYKKTQKLLDFGVEKVIWVMTDVRKILIAVPDNPWLLVNWHDDVEVFDGHSFNLTQLLKDEGVEI